MGGEREGHSEAPGHYKIKAAFHGIQLCVPSALAQLLPGAGVKDRLEFSPGPGRRSLLWITGLTALSTW